MKKIIILFIVIFFGFIISLELQSSSIPNIFIIEAIVAVSVYLLQATYRIIYLCAIKKKAENAKLNDGINLYFDVLTNESVDVVVKKTQKRKEVALSLKVTRSIGAALDTKRLLKKAISVFAVEELELITHLKNLREAMQ